MATTTETLRVKIEVDDNGKVKASLADAEQGLGKVNEKADGLFGTFKKLQGAIVAAFAASGASSIAERLIGDINEYQRLNAILRTIEGSQAAANARFAELEELAARTPFQLTEIVQGYTTLRSRGIEPTIGMLEAFGDVAAGQGRSLQQFVEAVADATSGEFERLKEFGITARQQGDQVALTFAGVTTTIRKSADEIGEYLQELGRTEFAGAMAEQANTLAGSWSNLQDAVSSLSNTIGESGLTEKLVNIVTALGHLVRISEAVTETTARMDEQVAQSFGGAGAYLQMVTDMLSSPGQVATDFVSAELGWVNEQISAHQEVEKSIHPLLQLYGDLQGKVRELGREYRAYAADQRDAAEAQAKIDANGAKFLATLTRQSDTFGKSKSQVLLYEAALEAAKVEDVALRESILKTAASLAERIQQEEDAEAAAKATAEALRAQAEQERDLAEAHREGLEHTRDLIDAEVEAREEADKNAEAREELVQAIEDYRAQLDPAIARINELREAELLLNDAVEAGILTRQQADALLAQHGQQQRGDNDGSGISDTFEGYFGDIFGALNGEGEDSAQQLLGTFSNVFADIGRVISGEVSTGVQAADAYLQSLGQTGQAVFGGLAQAAAVLAQNPDATGAAIGTVVGAIIGAFAGGNVAAGAAIGGAIGGLFDGDDDPEPRVVITDGLPPMQDANRAATGRTLFGTVSVGQQRDVEDGTVERFLEAIIQLDRVMAQILTPEEVALAAEALSGSVDVLVNSMVTGEEAIRTRLIRIVGAVAPEFSQFIASIEDGERALRAFVAIRDIQDQLENLDDVIKNLDSGPAERIGQRVRAFNEAIEQGQQALLNTFRAGDPEYVAQASRDLMQQVIERYEYERDMIRQLQADMAENFRALRDMSMTLAERLVDVGGDPAEATRIGRYNIRGARADIENAPDTETALQNLDLFVSAVDRWLQAARNEVNLWEQAQLAEVQTRLDALAAEQQAIIDAANLRLDALAEEEALIMGAARERGARVQRESAAGGAARQRANQAMIEALQEQLRLAQQWLGILESVRDLQDALTFGADNPLSGRARFDASDARVQALEAQLQDATGEERAAIAAQLMEALQTRLGLGQEVMQRPSAEYVELYNQTQADLAELAALAAGESSEIEALQEALAAAQDRTTGAVNAFASTTIQLTAAERARLDEIEIERRAIEEQREAELAAIEEERQRLMQEQRDIQAEAAARLAAIDEEARGYYEWARNENERLRAQRHQELREELHAITGGLDPDAYIAQRLAETTTLLGQIRDQLSDFLESLAGTMIIDPNAWMWPQPFKPDNPPGAEDEMKGLYEPPKGGSDYVGGKSAGGDTTVLQFGGLTVHAGLGTDGKQVADDLMDQLRVHAPEIKRMLKTA